MIDVEGNSVKPCCEYTIHSNTYKAWYAAYSRGWCKNFTSECRPISFTAPEKDSSYGIVLGSSDEPISPSDYNLKAKIEHSDTGLYYGKSSTYFSDIEKPIFHVYRDFQNKSAEDITIKEAGLIIKDEKDQKFLLFRDIVNQVLAPGELLAVDILITV